jgi:hypothetical protein
MAMDVWGQVAAGQYKVLNAGLCYNQVYIACVLWRLAEHAAACHGHVG